ncbi:MAG: enoyl-CoA hydratase/isomerase family protein, partial [Planctomycetes bacterium]|nr:enoyl-CoA hydratase/isomerase family protein [Planctomycetota bacterium]
MNDEKATTDMALPFFAETNDKGIHEIRLNRPERYNALTFEVYATMRDHFRDLQDDKSVRVVTITGEGKAFCSGGDVEDIIGPLLAMDMQQLLEFTRMTGALIRNIRQLRKPVIAGLNGTTCGAGAVIALACDFRVATQYAKIAFLFTQVGLSGADMGASFLLPRVVGLTHATELLMRGHFITPAEAMRIGLYNSVVDADALGDEVRALAEELASGPQFGLEMTKEMLNREMSMDLDSAIEADA